MTEKARILAVDDKPENIRLLEAILVPAGYQVTAASSGEDALAKVRAEHPDMVLLDIVMPAMSGYEVCRRLRSDPATKFLPIVTITASGGEEKRESLEAGADDFIPKPFDKTELLARVRSLLRLKTYHDTIERQKDELAEALGETEAALDRQTAIGDVLNRITASAFSLRTVLDTVIEHAKRICDANVAVIWRVEGERITYEAGAADDSEWRRVFEGQAHALKESFIVRGTVEAGAPFHVRDAAVEASGSYGTLSQKIAGYRTALGVPLVRDGQIIGVMSLTRAEVRPFSGHEIELVKTFADQAVIAIENARLFETIERQRQELSRFLSPQVAQLITSEEGARMLDGHRRQITVVFCDLRGFTAFAETAEPEEVFGVLREYHKAMGDLIVAHRGTLEHFAGDGMMVFFNDPLPVERHELQAVRMACTMRERFHEMSAGWKKKGYDLDSGVGIAVGYATLGRIGFEGRYDYGAVGNVVILASRLAAEAKGGQILLSQRLHAAVEDDVEAEDVGELTLKGFTRPIPAFNVVSVHAPAPATA